SSPRLFQRLSSAPDRAGPRLFLPFDGPQLTLCLCEPKRQLFTTAAMYRDRTVVFSCCTSQSTPGSLEHRESSIEDPADLVFEEPRLLNLGSGLATGSQIAPHSSQRVRERRLLFEHERTQLRRESPR